MSNFGQWYSLKLLGVVAVAVCNEFVPVYVPNVAVIGLTLSAPHKIVSESSIDKYPLLLVSDIVGLLRRHCWYPLNVDCVWDIWNQYSPSHNSFIRFKKRGWSLGWVSAVDREGRTIWIADAHRGDGKRFVVRADEKLTAFMELESATQAARRSASGSLQRLVRSYFFFARTSM